MVNVYTATMRDASPGSSWTSSSVSTPARRACPIALGLDLVAPTADFPMIGTT